MLTYYYVQCFFGYEEIALTRATISFLSSYSLIPNSSLVSYAYAEWRFELPGDYCSIGYGYYTIFPTAITKLLIFTYFYYLFVYFSN